MARTHHWSVVDVVSPPEALRQVMPSDTVWEHMFGDLQHVTNKPGLLAFR